MNKSTGMLKTIDQIESKSKSNLNLNETIKTVSFSPGLPQDSKKSRQIENASQNTDNSMNLYAKNGPSRLYWKALFTLCYLQTIQLKKFAEFTNSLHNFMINDTRKQD